MNRVYQYERAMEIMGPPGPPGPRGPPGQSYKSLTQQIYDTQLNAQLRNAYLPGLFYIKIENGAYSPLITNLNLTPPNIPIEIRDNNLFFNQPLFCRILFQFNNPDEEEVSMRSFFRTPEGGISNLKLLDQTKSTKLTYVGPIEIQTFLFVNFSILNEGYGLIEII